MMASWITCRVERRLDRPKKFAVSALCPVLHRAIAIAICQTPLTAYSSFYFYVVWQASLAGPPWLAAVWTQTFANRLTAQAT